MTKKIRYENSAEHRKDLEGWVCRECGRKYFKETIARWCCSNNFPCECGERMDGRYSPKRKCLPCMNREREERDRTTLEKAKLCEYDGNPFVVDGNFYCDVEEYDLAVENGDQQPAEFAFMTRQLGAALYLEEITDNLAENLGIDSDYDPSNVFHGLEELEAAIDKFNEQNKTINYWQEDNTRKFRINATRKAIDRMREGCER